MNITVCGHRFDQKDFHRILKPKVLQYLSEAGINYSKIGKNPDISCKQGKVILTGQKRSGGQIATGIKFNQILSDLGFLDEDSDME